MNSCLKRDGMLVILVPARPDQLFA